MPVFRVDDMTCGHCASTITGALKAVDKDAKVSIDLGEHLVQVESVQADAKGFSEALAEAGYTPVEVGARRAAPTASTAGDCCCGSKTGRCS